MKRLPRQIYEALPNVYIAIGLIAALGIRNAAGVLCGLVLISAGFVIRQMRLKYRQALAEAEKKTGRFARTGSAATRLVNLEWRAAYEVGHELIDAQHRRLVWHANELVEAMNAGQSRGHIGQALDALTECLMEHLSTEQSIMASMNHPLSAEHLDAHERLVGRLTTIQTKFRQHQITISAVLGFVIYDLLSQHMLKEHEEFAGLQLKAA
jgi:hemerythrin-like metal-binding protein